MKYLIILVNLLICSGLTAQSVAWDRANTLGKGINLSWLDHWWLGSANQDYSDYLTLNQSVYQQRKADILLMHEMGVKTLRLPVTFDKWEREGPPFTFEKVAYFAAIDSVLTWTAPLDMNVIIDYHHGNLFANNAAVESTRLIEHWKQIAEIYKTQNVDRVFYELYNEPSDLNPTTWQSISQNLINEIRKIDANRTLIIGGTEWNGVNGLLTLTPFSDDNIIYTFHFYEPFLFTHQGADWVGNPTATTGIEYPYNATTMPPMNPAVIGTYGEEYYKNYPSQGGTTYLSNKMQFAKNWSNTHNVPIFCGEWGSFRTNTDMDSRCRHMNDVIQLLNSKNIPYCWWDWDREFSFFYDTPNMSNLPDCFQQVWSQDIVPTNTIFEDDKVSVFPNPATDEVRFEGLENFQQLEIFGINGSKVGSYIIDENKITIDLNTYSKGLYAIRFLDEKNGKVLVKKMVKL